MLLINIENLVKYANARFVKNHKHIDDDVKNLVCLAAIGASDKQ